MNQDSRQSTDEICIELSSQGNCVTVLETNDPSDQDTIALNYTLNSSQVTNYSFKHDKRKLFVGGLPSDLTDMELRHTFEKYGQLLDSVVMIDKATNRPRGFGFVTFKDAKVSQYILDYDFLSRGLPLPEGGCRSGRFCIKNKWCEVKAAEPKDSTKEGTKRLSSRCDRSDTSDSSITNNNVTVSSSPSVRSHTLTRYDHIHRIQTNCPSTVTPINISFNNLPYSATSTNHYLYDSMSHNPGSIIIHDPYSNMQRNLFQQAHYSYDSMSLNPGSIIIHDQYSNVQRNVFQQSHPILSHGIYMVQHSSPGLHNQNTYSQVDQNIEYISRIYPLPSGSENQSQITEDKSNITDS